MTLELRAWLAASVPIFALASAVLMLALRPRARLLKVLAIEGLALIYFMAALILTGGPAVFLTPPERSQRLLVVAWLALTAVAAACTWQLRRRLYPAERVASIVGGP